MSLQDAPIPPPSPTPASPVMPGIRLVTTDSSGQICAFSENWPGESVQPVATLAELVHTRNHDLLDRMTEWVRAQGRIDRAVGVQVRSGTDWDEAVVNAMLVGTESDPKIQWCFMPLLPDPMRATVAAVTADRDVWAVLDVALGSFADAGPGVWATAHYNRGRANRYQSVVSTAGRDTFRRAVEAAVSGDDRCPWDADLDEEPQPLDLDVFGDGIKLAASHAGIGSCQLIPIPSVQTGDAACLGIWSETAGQLDSPECLLLVRRVTAAATLAFQMEEGRESQRTLATRDALTGLWNRPAFSAQLTEARSHTDIAVLCIDVDDFRGINDWYGSAVGDEVLVEVASRLGETMRPGDVVARVSGDEFAVLCSEVQSQEAATAIADRLLEACQAPFTTGGDDTDIHVSVGIALAAPERSGADLFDAAERAMLEAKDQARGSYLLA